MESRDTFQASSSSAALQGLAKQKFEVMTGLKISENKNKSPQRAAASLDHAKGALKSDTKSCGGRRTTNSKRLSKESRKKGFIGLLQSRPRLLLLLYFSLSSSRQSEKAKEVSPRQKREKGEDLL